MLAVRGGVRVNHVEVILRAHLCGDVLAGGFLSLAIVALCPPVGHNGTCEAPLVAQDGREQVEVAGRPNAVQATVGGHDGVCAALFYGRFKRAQVNFTQCALGKDGIDLGSLKLLVVAGKVLDGAGDTEAAHTAQLCGGELAGEQRVLREILKVSAV